MKLTPKQNSVPKLGTIGDAKGYDYGKDRIRYTSETMPAKARAFFAPMAGIPDLSYRGQVARN